MGCYPLASKTGCKKNETLAVHEHAITKTAKEIPFNKSLPHDCIQWSWWPNALISLNLWPIQRYYNLPFHNAPNYRFYTPHHRKNSFKSYSMCTQQVFIFKRPKLNPSYYSSFRYDRTRHQPYSKDQHLIGSRYILHIKQLEGEVMLNYSPVQFSKVHNLDTIGINICRNIPSLSSLAQSPMHLRISTNHRRKAIRMRTWELHTHWALAL